MGWTSYCAKTKYKNGKIIIDRKEECDNIFNQDMVTYDSDKVIGKFEVLKSAMVGSTYYAAVKRTKFETETESEKSIVFAVVCVTRVDTKEYLNFSYKDMDETCGPYQHDCPKSILDLLTPTDNEYANEWRAACYRNIKRKQDKNSLSNLPIGSIIKYTQFGGEEIVLIKHPAAYQFKRSFWMVKDKMKYISQKYIPHNYEVIKRGE